MGGQELFKSRKWIFLAETILILIGLGLSLHACDHVGATKEREIMEMTKANSTLNHAIPPIDVSAPLRTETATFALG
jgi:hypothetical protein